MPKLKDLFKRKKKKLPTAAADSQSTTAADRARFENPMYDYKPPRTTSPLGVWDKRGTPRSTWEPLLIGKPSGTFVVRTSTDEGAIGVVATITVVKPMGKEFFNQTIVGFTGSTGRREYAVAGSKHDHQSLEALVKFYKDPLYFAQSGKLDVPAQLIDPASSSATAASFHKAYGAATPAAETRAGGEEMYEDMWWRKDGTMRALPSPAEAAYGTMGGGTLKGQERYERIIEESDYGVLAPYNPLDELGRTPLMTLTKAVEVLAKYVKGDTMGDCKKALAYAKKHKHLGKVQRPGGEKLTADDIAVLHLYTMPTNFYSKMNEELGGYGADSYGKVEHFLPVTKLLLAAFDKLPPVPPAKLFRGVKMNYKAILKTPEGGSGKVVLGAASTRRDDDGGGGGDGAAAAIPQPSRSGSAGASSKPAEAEYVDRSTMGQNSVLYAVPDAVTAGGGSAAESLYVTRNDMEEADPNASLYAVAEINDDAGGGGGGAAAAIPQPSTEGDGAWNREGSVFKGFEELLNSDDEIDF
eukprot:gene612-17602_t